MDRSALFSVRRTVAAAVLAALAATGCVYDDHASFGATEKWVESDINYVPKIIGTPFVAIADGIVAPATAWVDQFETFEFRRDEVYHPDHRYLSYAGSRVIARSGMGDGYKWGTSIFSIIFDTVWLPVTGIVDLVTVLSDDDGQVIED